MAQTEVFKSAIESIYTVYGFEAEFSPLVGDDVSLVVLLESVEDWQPGGEIRYAHTQLTISYKREDLDRRVKRGETFTIGTSVYTVQSMSDYPDSWTEFEGKAMVVES